MPFTASHPAAVLPFMGGGLVPSALVIGSMSPDLPYFVPVPVAQSTTHAVAGIVTVDLAIAAACFVVWQGLVAPAAVALAPRGLRARLAPDLPVPLGRHFGSARGVLLVVLSLIVGAATHVAWDAFTHEGRWGVRQFDTLSATYGPLAGYRWAQYGSGALGLLLIAVATGAWWWRTTPDPGGQRVPAVAGRWAWVVWAALLLVTATMGAIGFADAFLESRGERFALYQGATWGGGAGLVGVLGVAIVATPMVRARRRGARPPGPSDPE